MVFPKPCGRHPRLLPCLFHTSLLSHILLSKLLAPREVVLFVLRLRVIGTLDPCGGFQPLRFLSSVRVGVFIPLHREQLTQLADSGTEVQTVHVSPQSQRHANVTSLRPSTLAFEGDGEAHSSQQCQQSQGSLIGICKRLRVYYKPE